MKKLIVLGKTKMDDKVLVILKGVEWIGPNSYLLTNDGKKHAIIAEASPNIHSMQNKIVSVAVLGDFDYSSAFLVMDKN